MPPSPSLLEIPPGPISLPMATKHPLPNHPITYTHLHKSAYLIQFHSFTCQSSSRYHCYFLAFISFSCLHSITHFLPRLIQYLFSLKRLHRDLPNSFPRGGPPSTYPTTTSPSYPTTSCSVPPTRPSLPMNMPIPVHHPCTQPLYSYMPDPHNSTLAWSPSYRTRVTHKCKPRFSNIFIMARVVDVICTGPLRKVSRNNHLNGTFRSRNNIL